MAEQLSNEDLAGAMRKGGRKGTTLERERCVKIIEDAVGLPEPIKKELLHKLTHPGEGRQFPSEFEEPRGS